MPLGFIASPLLRMLLVILVDRVLAVVAGHPITLSEVDLEARILLAMRGGAKAMKVKLDQDFRCRTLETVVHQYLISAEADRLKLESVNEEQLADALKSFRARFDSEKSFDRFLHRLELSRQDLMGILARHMRVERLLDNRIGSRVVIFPREVQQLMHEQPSRFDSAAAARRHLRQEKQRGLLADWLGELQGRFTVRLISPPADASAVDVLDCQLRILDPNTASAEP